MAAHVDDAYAGVHAAVSDGGGAELGDGAYLDASGEAAVADARQVAVVVEVDGGPVCGGAALALKGVYLYYACGLQEGII